MTIFELSCALCALFREIRGPLKSFRDTLVHFRCRTVRGTSYDHTRPRAGGSPGGCLRLPGAGGCLSSLDSDLDFRYGRRSRSFFPPLVLASHTPTDTPTDTLDPQRPAGVDLHPAACNSAGGDAVTAHLRVHPSPSTLYRRRPVLAQATG
jgi:hypothetical protein